MAFSPENPVGLIAESCGVGMTTVNRWIESYKQGGLDAVIERGTDRNHRPLKADEEVLQYLDDGLQAQRWNTLVEATAELERRFDYKTVFLETPTVNLDWTEAFLVQIKKQYPDHEHIVVWDGAGFHSKDKFHEQVPQGGQ